MTPPAGVLPVPDFGGGSLADVLPAVLGRWGVPGEVSGLGLEVSRRVVLLLVDGLGWHALRRHATAAPFLTSLADDPRSRRITSVFPTTTPIALTSLGTGRPPGEHGVTGLFLHLDGRLVSTLALPAQTDMRALQPAPTAFERAAAAGVAVTRVGPRAFDGQGLTEAGLRGGAYAAGESMGERVAAAAAANGDTAPALTYVYVGDLDATGHRRGVSTPQWRAELTHVDRVAEQLAAALPSGTTLLVTSDHGMLDVPVECRVDVSGNPDLDAGVLALAGDPRGAFVHAAPGAADDVLAAWSELLGADFWVLASAEAEAAGLFGPVVADHVRPRLGDVVVAARGAASVVDTRVTDPALLALVGGHGSLTDEELHVPLFVHDC